MKRGRGEKGRGLPGRENDDVCIERAPVLEFQARRREAGYLGVVLEFNLPIDYQLARADICASHTRWVGVSGFCDRSKKRCRGNRTEVISTGLAPREQEEPRAVYARVEPETNAAESVQRFSDRRIL